MDNPVNETQEKVKQGAQEITDQVKQQAAETAERARTEGRRFAERQKERAAEELGTIEAALQRAADKLREDGDDRLADYAAMAADRVGQIGRFVQERDLRRFVDDAEAFTRRRPELVLGGLFVVGLGIARFLKASAPSDRRRTESGWSDQGSRSLARYRDEQLAPIEDRQLARVTATEEGEQLSYATAGESVPLTTR